MTSPEQPVLRLGVLRVGLDSLCFASVFYRLGSTACASPRCSTGWARQPALRLRVLQVVLDSLCFASVFYRLVSSRQFARQGLFSYHTKYVELPKTFGIGSLIVVGQTVGSISSQTLAYDCLCKLELCTASMIATSLLGHFGDFLRSVCTSCS